MRLPFLELELARALSAMCPRLAAIDPKKSELLRRSYLGAISNSQFCRVGRAQTSGNAVVVCAPSVSFSQGKDLYSKTRNGILATVILCPR